MISGAFSKKKQVGNLEEFPLRFWRSIPPPKKNKYIYIYLFSWNSNGAPCQLIGKDGPCFGGQGSTTKIEDKQVPGNFRVFEVGKYILQSVDVDYTDDILCCATVCDGKSVDDSILVLLDLHLHGFPHDAGTR